MRVSEVLRDLPQTVRTLAEAEVGRCLLVNGILADTVRTRLAASGVAEGALVICREQAPESSVVELLDGRSRHLPRPWARCVRVEPAGDRRSRPSIAEG